MDARAFASEARAGFEDATAALQFEELIENSPFARLSERHQKMVFAATDAYVVLGVSPHASEKVLRAGFVRRAKELHPDVRPGDPTATADMIRLNQAWEVLRDPALREAYDWLQENREALFV
jgi:hypothetical protein